MNLTTRLLLVIGCAPLLLSAQDNLKTTVTQRYFNSVRRNLEAAADAMPDSKYGYKLTERWMSFAEWINHSTERNFADCAALKGESAPEAAGGKLPGLEGQGSSQPGA